MAIASSTRRAASSMPVTLDFAQSLADTDMRAVNGVILSRVVGEIALIEQLAQHIIASGGKRIRPLLTLLSAHACGYENGTRHIDLAAAVEFIHTATLLHDDVVDESALRRGLATANAVFGNKASVLVGDFLLAQAFMLMVETGSLDALTILSSASAVISKGEVLQLMTEGEPDTSYADYLAVIRAKTAELFAAACELGAVVSGQPDLRKPLRAYGDAIGIAFQLVDDALDYGSSAETLGKTIGDDFRESKVTFPVITAWSKASSAEREFWERTLRERSQQEGDLQEALRLIRRHGGIDATFAEARRYCDIAARELAALPQGPYREALESIVHFCAQRAY